MDKYEVIIIGGSFAGLSAALCLGRAQRKVLIIDSGLPCNRFTPISQNFLTRDSESPDNILKKGLRDVRKYPTVEFLKDLALSVKKISKGFQIITWAGNTYTSRKLILATGLKDKIPQIPGFKKCWGISILHCPYCHGYEVKNTPTGILGNREIGFEMAKLLSQWTEDLKIFTNGPARFSEIQLKQLNKNKVDIVEHVVSCFTHDNGRLRKVVFENDTEIHLKAIYVKPTFEQSSTIPMELKCQLTTTGLLKIDEFQKTNIPGLFACGDNSNIKRTISFSLSSGTNAGMSLNKELIEEGYYS